MGGGGTRDCMGGQGVAISTIGIPDGSRLLDAYHNGLGRFIRSRGKAGTNTAERLQFKLGSVAADCCKLIHYTVLFAFLCYVNDFYVILMLYDV